MSNGEVKRFSLVTDIVGGDEWTGLRRHAEGYYMSYADHERIVAEKDREIQHWRGVYMGRPLAKCYEIAQEQITMQKRVIDAAKELVEFINKEGPSMINWERVTYLCAAIEKGEGT